MATEVSAPPSMPQLQSIQKAMALPTVGAAVCQVGAFYSKVKGAHSLLEWALSTAEASVTLAAATAAPYVAAPLAAGDARIAAAIGELERRVPLVAEPPKVIVETTKQAVLSRISPHVNKVCVARAAAEQRVHSLKDLSWAKANALLSTAYGQKAVQGLDTGASYAMQLLDQYLPPVGHQTDNTGTSSGGAILPKVDVRGSLRDRSWAKANELLATPYGQKALNGIDTGAYYAMWLLDQYLPPVGSQPEQTSEVTAATADPALHTVQTVGRLSSVAARRVWANLAYKVNELRNAGIELDVRRYVTALMAALHLAKVTSDQQQAEQCASPEPSASTASDPAPPTPQVPLDTQTSAPTTANQVKATPEGKSDISESSNTH